MRFAKFWAKASAHGAAADGRELDLVCWRSSDRSADDARAAARTAVDEIAARVQASGEPPDRYAYGERLLREEVVRTLDGSADAAAVVSRNSFGCLVLNTTRAMFVDVDLPEERPAARSGGSWLGRLFGRSAPPPPPEHPAARSLARLESWVKTKPGVGFRIYRTAAGLRYLATSGLYEPGSSESEGVLEVLGSDPLYVRLCRVQKSFRARLTPKPWRCDMVPPPSRWPHESAEHEAAFRDWLASYDAACAPYAACAYVSTVGEERVHPEVEPILRVHDEASRAASGLPLA